MIFAKMLRSLTIVFSLALGLGACTVHRHYHQAPQQPEATTAYNSQGNYENDGYDYDRAGPPGADDRPIPPSYARPAPYSRNYPGAYGYSQRSDDYGYDACDCDCEDRPRARVRRRSIRRRTIRRPPPPRRGPGPVIPENPVEWLE